MIYNEKQIELIEAYKSTKYLVYEPYIEIVVNRYSLEIEKLFSVKDILEWAYITPYNPYSKIFTDIENENRFNKMRGMITKFKFFEGEGVGTDTNWKPEKSLLIVGISKDDAIQIGNKFEQNAIIIGNKNGVAELLLLDSFYKIR